MTGPACRVSVGFTQHDSIIVNQPSTEREGRKKYTYTLQYKYNKLASKSKPVSVQISFVTAIRANLISKQGEYTVCTRSST